MKMDRKMFFSVLVISIIIIIAAGYFMSNPSADKKDSNLTGELATLSVNPGSKIKTVAFCNESNFCQDYKIVCKNKEIIEKTPIEGATVQHPDNWTDPRNMDYDNLCG
jgi:hypothetical protein